MKISNIPVFAFFLLSITYGCNNKNEEVDNQQSSEVEVLTPDPTHGLRPVDLSDHELDIHIFVPEQFYDDENGYPRFVQPIISHNLGEAKWEITLPGRSKWHLVIEETLHDSVTVNDEIERLNNLDKVETYFKFAKDVEKIKNKSLKKVNKILAENKKIIGYGAPAKATTILNYFGIDNYTFEFTVDDNQLKHNKYIPGVNLKILNSNNKIIDNVDYVIVLAWNFFDEIVKKNKEQFPKSKFIKIK